MFGILPDPLQKFNSIWHVAPRSHPEGKFLLPSDVRVPSTDTHIHIDTRTCYFSTQNKQSYKHAFVVYI